MDQHEDDDDDGYGGAIAAWIGIAAINVWYSLRRRGTSGPAHPAA
jgi:hypothetical protein